MQIRKQIKLFLTAFLQVTLVAMNVVFISNKQVIPMLITGFGISFIWTLNVRSVAFGNNLDKFIYASGASLGTGVGFYLSNYITKLI